MSSLCWSWGPGSSGISRVPWAALASLAGFCLFRRQAFEFVQVSVLVMTLISAARNQRGNATLGLFSNVHTTCIGVATFQGLASVFGMVLVVQGRHFSVPRSRDWTLSGGEATLV
ncbi:uncharacterized protein LY79DRAFT_572581 [Colletotrichum navitas]|uniref:Uncharacterized protein n=1 Tax=Colletotrichum navitas TaxID=681940 RepID=A0AAD8UYT3_9PEZI|nr:uncharacterized protein LY79DRAFT_572581 [Colletotrichum navitas]KAK1566166.1 hypothetical protein LY79DRAFT_572581 [Colletotrichum navitas]